MTNEDVWVALSLSHIGGKTLRALSKYFDGDLVTAIKADAKTLRQINGIGPMIAESIREIDLNRTLRDMFEWQQAGVRIVTRRDAAYPSPLLEIDDEPATLFVRGLWEADLWNNAVAIVGTREPAEDSREIAYRLGAGLADQEFTIVSGLAQGIDTAAHQGALSIADGRTVAVLGCGVLRVYPPENAVLAENIIERGALVCEVSPVTTVHSSALVARNRIISGLCQAVIVVETDDDGGAMYAARCAMQQGRRVYALDIPASGNRELIQSGAIPIPADVGELSL